MARTKNETVKDVKTSTKNTKAQSKEVKEEKTMAKNTKTMELTAEEVKAIEAMRAKAAKKANEKPFDRAKYESIGEALGVLGAHGVYKFARPTVYKLMEEEKFTKKMIAEAKAELEAIAKKQNLTWFLESDEDEVEMDEEEAI